jgi:hypothetical protein
MAMFSDGLLLPSRLRFILSGHSVAEAIPPISPFDPDVRGCTFDVTEIFGSKFNVSGSEVFFKAMQLGCAWNRNYPRFFASSQASAS